MTRPTGARASKVPLAIRGRSAAGRQSEEYADDAGQQQQPADDEGRVHIASCLAQSQTTDRLGDR